MVERILFGPGGASEVTLAALLVELGQKLEAGQAVALDAATLAALESVTATVTGTVALDGPTLAALETVSALVSGTVGLDAATLAALETITATISGNVAVTGPLTDTQLRAAAVPVSLPSTTVTGSVTVTGPLTSTQAAALSLSLDATSVAIRDLLTTIRDGQYRRTDPLPAGTNTIGHVLTTLPPLVPMLSLASAAYTTSGTTAALDVSVLSRIAVDVNVSAVSGAVPSLMLSVDRQGTDGLWYLIYTSPAVTTVRTVTTSIGQGMTVAQSLGSAVRLRWDITGATSSFTFSASIVGK